MSPVADTASPESELARLRARLETIAVIEQAKGILMATYRCGPDEAFELLRRASQSRHIAVYVLATKLIERAAAK